jgi:hypothetical protein
MTVAHDQLELTRTALERVCTRAEPELAADCYAEDFADHVNGLEYHGLDGVDPRSRPRAHAAGGAASPPRAAGRSPPAQAASLTSP